MKNIKTLRSKSILVSLTISQWGNRRNEKTLASELSNTHQTEEGFLSVSKSLIGREKTKAITAAATALRDTFNKSTLPWSKTGQRILRADKYFEVSQILAEKQRAMETAVDDLIAVYPDLVNEARTGLKGLFHPEQYPSVEQLKRKFKIAIDFARIPDVTDFRIDGMSESTIEQVQKQVEAGMKEKFDGAVMDLCERVAKVTGHFVNLMASDAKFRKSSISNLAEMAADIRGFNGLLENPEFDSMADKLEDLGKLDADLIRTNDKEREAAAKKGREALEEVQNRMKGLF